MDYLVDWTASRACLAVFLALGCLASTGLAQNETDKDLLSAAEDGEVGAILSLLSAGARVDTVDDDGRTPLSRAAREGNVEAGRVLVEAGADQDIADKDRRTPLFRAVDKGLIEVVRLLAERGADPAPLDKNDRTALFRALEKESFDIAALLLRITADNGGIGPWIDSADEDGQTALMRAAGSGALDIVRTLVGHGARLDLQDEDGRTASVNANEEGEEEVLQLLRATEDANSALVTAVDGDDIDAVAKSLNSGAQVDARNTEGSTVLSLAISRMNQSLVDLLLNRGANPGFGNGPSNNPLMEAVKQSNTSLVSRILAAGVRVPETEDSPQEDSVLSVAIRGGDIATLRVLIEEGELATIGENRVIEAATTGDPQVLELLLQHGASVRSSALEVSTDNGFSLEIWQLLLGHSESIPQSLLMTAVDAGTEDLVNLFLEAGADVNSQETVRGLNVELFSNGYTIDSNSILRGLTAL